MRYGFKTPLQTSNLGKTKTLVGPLVYDGKLTGLIYVPQGFPTDLASFSIGNMSLRGKTEEPAVLHDFLYAVGSCSRAQADIIFFHALRDCGVGKTRAFIYWAVVRCFGNEAWHNHRMGRTQAAKFILFTRR